MPDIPSVPATFSLGPLAGGSTETVDFAIPIGGGVSGDWLLVGTSTNSAVGNRDAIRTPSQADGVEHLVGPFAYSVDVSAAQLTEINAAAGGNLSVDFTAGADFSNPTWQCDVLSFILRLNTAGGGGGGPGGGAGGGGVGGGTDPDSTASIPGSAFDPSSYVGTFPVKNDTYVWDGALVGLDTSQEVVLADADGLIEAKGFAYFGGVYPGRQHASGTNSNSTRPHVSIYRRGLIGGFESMTPGGAVYLSISPGAYSQDKPSDASILQEVGWAVTPKFVKVDIKPSITKKQAAAATTMGLR